MDAMRKLHDEQDIIFAMIEPDLKEIIRGENTSGENCRPDHEWQDKEMDAKLD